MPEWKYISSPWYFTGKLWKRKMPAITAGENSSHLFLSIAAAKAFVLGGSGMLAVAARLNLDAAESAVCAVLIVSAAENTATDSLTSHLILGHEFDSLLFIDFAVISIVCSRASFIPNNSLAHDTY